MPDYNIGRLSVEYQSKGFAQLSRQIDLVGNKISRLASPITDLTHRIAGMMNPIRALGALLGGTAITAGITGMVRLASEAENTQAAFEVFMGSAAKARKLILDLRKFAIETPMVEAQIKAATRLLLGLGAASDSIVPTLRMLGNVSEGIQRPLQDIAYIYGTLIKQGRVFTIDIRQFALRGIPIVEYLAKVMKTTEQNIYQMVSKGKVNFKHIEAAFQAMTSQGGKYAGVMQKMSQTLSGRWSTFSDAFEVGVLIPLGEAITETLRLKDVLNVAITWAENFGNTFGPKIKAVQLWIKVNWETIKQVGKGFAVLNGYIGGILALKMAFAGIASIVGFLLSPLSLVAILVASILDSLAKEKGKTIFAFLSEDCLQFGKDLLDMIVRIKDNWRVAWDFLRNYAKYSLKVIQNELAKTFGLGGVNVGKPPKWPEEIGGFGQKPPAAAATTAGGQGPATWERWGKKFGSDVRDAMWALTAFVKEPEAEEKGGKAKKEKKKKKTKADGMFYTGENADAMPPSTGGTKPVVTPAGTSTRYQWKEEQDRAMQARREQSWFVQELTLALNWWRDEAGIDMTGTQRNYGQPESKTLLEKLGSLFRRPGVKPDSGYAKYLERKRAKEQPVPAAIPPSARSPSIAETMMGAGTGPEHPLLRALFPRPVLRALSLDKSVAAPTPTAPAPQQAPYQPLHISAYRSFRDFNTRLRNMVAATDEMADTLDRAIERTGVRQYVRGVELFSMDIESTAALVASTRRMAQDQIKIGNEQSAFIDARMRASALYRQETEVLSQNVYLAGLEKTAAESRLLATKKTGTVEKKVKQSRDTWMDSINRELDRPYAERLRMGRVSLGEQERNRAKQRVAAREGMEARRGMAPWQRAFEFGEMGSNIFRYQEPRAAEAGRQRKDWTQMPTGAEWLASRKIQPAGVGPLNARGEAMPSGAEWLASFSSAERGAMDARTTALAGKSSGAIMERAQNAVDLMGNRFTKLKTKVEDAKGAFLTFSLAAQQAAKVPPDLLAFQREFENFAGVKMPLSSEDARTLDTMRMKFNAITAAYDRGAKSGTFTWGEFSRLQKNVPNLLENTAKAMGISTEELEKQLKTRKKGETAVKAEDVLKGMQEGLKAELEKAKLAGEADKAAAGSGKALTAQERKRAEWEERVKTRRQEAVKNAQKAAGKGKGPAEGGWRFGGISDVQVRTGTLGRLGAEMGRAAKSKEDKMMGYQQQTAAGMERLTSLIDGNAGLKVNVNNPDDIGARVAPGGPR